MRDSTLELLISRSPIVVQLHIDRHFLEDLPSHFGVVLKLESSSPAAEGVGGTLDLVQDSTKETFIFLFSLFRVFLIAVASASERLLLLSIFIVEVPSARKGSSL